MDERHVPPIGLRYWIFFLVASVFGGHVADLFAELMSIGILDRMLILAAIIVLVFVIERYDGSSTDAYYWAAVVVMQTAAVRLADLSAIRLGIGRAEFVGALILLLATTVIVSRSDETHLFATLQLERPGTSAKPLADVAHWLGMIVASILGAAAADLFAITFGAGTAVSAALFLAAVAVLLHLQRPSRPNRLHAFWLTTVLARADGISIGDLLANGAHFQLGLPVSTGLTAALLVGLVLIWRTPASQV